MGLIAKIISAALNMDKIHHNIEKSIKQREEMLVSPQLQDWSDDLMNIFPSLRMKIDTKNRICWLVISNRHNSISRWYFDNFIFNLPHRSTIYADSIIDARQHKVNKCISSSIKSGKESTVKLLLIMDNSARANRWEYKIVHTRRMEAMHVPTCMVPRAKRIEK